MTKVTRITARLVLVLGMLVPITPAAAAPGNVGAAAATTASRLRVASFNALGASHTAPGGNAPGRLPATTRTRLLVEILDNRSLDLVGLQEFQPIQQRTFREFAGDRYRVWCAPSPGVVDNCVAWRRSKVRLVATNVMTIPYFHGLPRRMPHLVLRDRATGRVFTAMSVHNPYNCCPRAHAWRVEGWRREAYVARHDTAHRPVLLLGDRNAGWAEYGPHIPAGGFHPAGRIGIDFIVGSPRVAFSGYQSVRTPRIRAASDHPLVEAVATLN